MKEIERKFRVINWDSKKDIKASHILQAYLFNDELAHLRVRIINNTQAFLGLKKRYSEKTRLEYEYPLDLNDARELIEHFSNGKTVEKLRYQAVFAGKRWDVDEFLGENQGLILAEIELESEEEDFERPAWLAEEVTRDPRYLNVNLAKFPYKEW